MKLNAEMTSRINDDLRATCGSFIASSFAEETTVHDIHGEEICSLKDISKMIAELETIKKTVEERTGLML